MGYLLRAFKSFDDFSGKADRKEYWMFILIFFVLAGICEAIDKVTKTDVLSSILALIFLIPTVSLTVRRLHDTGRSGQNIFYIFFPLGGFLILLYFLAQNSLQRYRYTAGT